MPLVHVADSGFDAHGLQGAQAANAEEDLLPDAHSRVAPVEAGGNIAVRRDVFVEISIEQIELHPAHLHLPDPRLHRAVGKGNFNGEVLSIAAVDRLYGHLVEVVFRVALYLPAVGVEGLAEIALAVEQTDPDEGTPRSLAALR